MVMSPPRVGQRKRKGPLPRFVARPSVSFDDTLDDQIAGDAETTGQEYAEVVRAHVDYWLEQGGPDLAPHPDLLGTRRTGTTRWPRRKSVGFTPEQFEALVRYQDAWALPAFSDAVRIAVLFTRAHRAGRPTQVATTQQRLIPQEVVA